MFSGGSINKNNAKNVKFQSYENSHTPDGLERKKNRKILVADSGKLQYTGCNYGTQASQRGELNKYFVGVRNKKTGMMTVHEIQLVHCVPHLNITSHEDDEDNYKTKTYTEKSDLLTSAFGSKRKRQAMESYIAYTEGTTEGSSVADSIDVNDLKQNNTGVGETPDSAVAQVIPPRNTSATTPDKVYDIKDIISLEEYYALEPMATTLVEATLEQFKEWKAESTYAELVLQNLQNSKTSVDVNRAKLLVYYNYLVQISRLIARDVKKKDPLPNIPEPFKNKFLERFTLTSSNEHGTLMRTMPMSMKDKTMIYATILALFIEDFRVDLSVLQRDFKKGCPTLMKIANALGCHIITQKKNNVSVKIAELKLPLFVPPQKTYRRGK